MTINFFGVQVHGDFRGRLATNPAGGPTSTLAVASKEGTVLHYAGGAQNLSLSDLALWQSYARWHIRQNGFGNGFTGNGIMYHLGAGRDGYKAGLFDLRVMRWHAGSPVHNLRWAAINIPLGGSQDATYAQKVAVEEMLHDLWRAGVGNRQRFIGHQEAAPGTTACPGVLQRSIVREVRAGTVFGKGQTPPPKPETVAPDHLVVEVPAIGTFWIIGQVYKRYVAAPEPLLVYGYPISGLRGNSSDGYVQQFERARLEHRPGSGAPFDVQLGRVGAELASLRYPELWREKRGQFEPVERHGETSSTRHYRQTGQSVAHGFKAFFDRHGGIEQFGYPVSREFRENGRNVQYFERARFEWHPDAAWSPEYHNVALGRVNAERLELLESVPDVTPPPAPRTISLDSWVRVSEPVDITAKQVVTACYATRLVHAPAYDRATVEEIARQIIRWAEVFGFRASIVAAQILHETGRFRYGNQVKAEQFNFAGLGADNTGAAGASFRSVEEGVLAVYCHMALYVYGDTPDWPSALRVHAPLAIRRNSVAWAHENRRLHDGTRLGYFGSVERVRDYVNGRHAEAPAHLNIPLGSLDNGYAHSLVRVANEIITTKEE